MVIELSVGSIAPEEAGRGVARIPRAVMNDMGVAPGEFVSLTGKHTTVAKAYPGYANDRDDVVRIDGSIRANAGVALDDPIVVERVTPRPADRVVLAPPAHATIQGGEGFLGRHLLDRPVVAGDAVRIHFLGAPVVFVVTETTPSGPVVVTERTVVSLREKPATESDFERPESDFPRVSYEDVGGLNAELDQVRETIELPLRHPELFRRLGIDPPKGVLLYGPPGTGKTLIARAVANEVDAHFVPVSGPEIMSKYYGESEERLREIFEEAAENAPTVVLFDEFDAIAPDRSEVTGEMERRIVAQLLSLMDGLEGRGDVVVVAATNRVDAIDPALRRGGRFDREIEIGVPNRDGREEILAIHTRGMPLADDVDLATLADRTHGFVGADLASLVREAALAEVRQLTAVLDSDVETIPLDVLDAIEVTADDFADALRRVTPSAMRETLVDLPDVTFDDVGGLEGVKLELTKAIQWPLAYPDLFARFATEPPRGILLYGPPGTGKTLLAKAVANASEANFISVKGPELLDKYVGESEKAVRDLFAKARQNAPTLVFVDEVDAVAPQRGQSSDSRVTERVVSQLLTEIDGIEELSNVVVVAATNRPDMVDAALLRSGRLEKLVHVPVPDEFARREILAIHTRGMPLADDVNLDHVAAVTEGYTGSDLEAIAREAGLFAMEDVVMAVDPDVTPVVEDATVAGEHFERALKSVRPSVTPDLREHYEAMADRLGGAVTERPDLAVGFQ